MDVFLK